MKSADTKKNKDKPSMKALKDFHIFRPGRTNKDSFDIKISEGDDLKEVPEEFHINLKTEGVI